MNHLHWRACRRYAANVSFGLFAVSQPASAAAQRPQDAVPDWAKGVVWYQIFPERFRNGDRRNDPTLADLNGAWPHDNNPPWQIHPWTSDWYKLQPYELSNGKDFWWNVQRRRYGGDLQGILDKLDYLKDLGIGGIYLNPVFTAPSSHKYDAATYHHIDPSFGPDPAGDQRLIAAETPGDPSTWVWTSADKLALKLIRECHKRGMRIIFDGVFNHMGQNSWAFRDVVKNQERSNFADWFKIKSWDDPAKETSFDYQGWFGVRELPEFRQDAGGIVAGPRDYIFQMTRRWMDPNGDGNPSDGIDGWRLDVAYMVAHPFWKDWRRHVRSINPDAYLTAEVIGTPEVLRPYLQGDEFDAVMNYGFASACSQFFLEGNSRITASEFDARLRAMRAAFPSHVSWLQQNLLDSHDTSRVASFVVNRSTLDSRNWGRFFESTKSSNPAYNTRKPDAKEIRLQKLMVILQMTYVGAPMVYYGDEAGMWGANDPDCRKPMLWPGMRYAPEAVLPSQTSRPKPDTVAFNTELFQHYRKLIHIRNSTPALRLGDYQTLLADDKRGVFAFARAYRKQRVIVVVNNGDTAQTVVLPRQDGARLVDLMDGRHVNGAPGIRVPERWARILQAER